MAKPKNIEDLLQTQIELSRTSTIATLALGGVGQKEIAKILHLSLNTVNAVAKHIKKREKGSNRAN